MDDLEKAILYSYEVGGAVDPGIKSQAIAYSQRMKETPSICRLCIERLPLTEHVQVQFWCLQTIQEAIRLRHASMDPAELSFLRESLLCIACSGGGAATTRICGGPAYIKNKFAQVFVSLLYFEYPSTWSSPFVELLSHLSKGIPVIDMFCRILISLDDEIISMEYPRASEEIAVSGRIKDAMRLQCVPQIVRAWYDIVSLYKESYPDLAAMVLDTTRRYITWIDIGLIANDAFVPMLFDLILGSGLAEPIRAAAASCVAAIVLKRMDAGQKLTLLRSLSLNRVSHLVADDDNPELVTKLASLIIAYAAELLDCLKKLGTPNGDNASMEQLDETLPSVLYVMQNCEVDSSLNAVQFLSDYVSTMKSSSPKHAVYVGQILELIRKHIAYDQKYRENLDLPDKVGMDEEDEMTENRKEYFALFRSICRAAPDVTQLFIRNLLSTHLTSSEFDVEGIEATLTLFYRLGETVSDEGMRSGVRQLKEMIPILLSAHFPCHSHRIVALVYLDTITRYMKFVQENTQYIPHMLAAFLDGRGIHHPNRTVSKRASYLFMRSVKLLKAQLIPFIETILQSLQDTVARFTTLDWSSKELKSSSSEDGSHTFEAIGLLIGMEDVSPEKQSEYLASLLTPLCRQVEVLLLDTSVQQLEESSTKIASLQQIIMAINALSKGFSERTVTGSRPAIGLMFKQTLDVLLQILVLFPKTEPLRSKVTSFLHRMVEILGQSMFPYLPIALEKLLAKSEPKEMVDFLVLINQLICKFGSAVSAILEDIFPTIASRIFHILPKDICPSGPGSNNEEMRELQELQKTMYTFLHVLTTHDLSCVLLAPKSRAFVDPVMQLLLISSCKHKDVVVRKTCVQVIVRLIKDWCATGDEKVPGFRNFIIQCYATNCCLFSVLDNSFNFRDANTLLLFGEIVTAQKVMYDKFGNDFLLYFVQQGLPAAHCPLDLAEQYYQKLQKGDDIKELRSFYQSLIENLRQQQNGSLVFR